MKLDVLLSGNESAFEALHPTRLTEPEAIILKTGRPALIVRNGEWESPRIPELVARLARSRDALKRALPSVGRVEVLDHGLFVGTGWMLEPDVMVTNSHVARLFAAARGNTFGFSADNAGRTHRVRIDFRREYESSATHQARAVEVAFLEVDSASRPDMALVRLDSAGGLPDPIELDDGNIDFRGDVALIGYPAEDSRNDAFVMRRIFNDIYDVKRLCPGRVSGVRNDGMVFTHDCTSLGGASGSVLVNLDTGKACGLHYAGSYEISNYAVSSAALKQRLIQLGRRHFGGIGRPEVRMTPSAPDRADGEPEGVVSRSAARAGYDREFLGVGALSVPLPEVVGDDSGELAPVTDRDDGELQYTHFSIKMRADRRIAYFTACNIDGTRLFNLPRGRDRWFADDRIDAAHQTDESLYARNQLDRGHLVRRLDPAWGDTREEAAQAVDDTFYFTNCSPQHARLNQRTWLALEDYVLQNAATRRLRVSVFTGPVLRGADRVYRDVQLPEEYWKVVVIVNAFTGRLSATGYLLSQAEDIEDLEFVYGEFRTYQVPLREIAEKTGIEFGELVAADPLGEVESIVRREIAGADDLQL